MSRRVHVVYMEVVIFERSVHVCEKNASFNYLFDRRSRMMNLGITISFVSAQYDRRITYRQNTVRNKHSNCKMPR